MSEKAGSPGLVLTQRSWRMDGPEAIHLLAHLMAPVLVFVVGIVLVDTVLRSTPANCAYTDALLPAWHIVVAGVGGLVFGRYLSRWGQRRRYTRHDRWNAAIGYGAWFWVFLLLGGIWFYEAMGTAHVAADATGRVDFEPITYYVRCAAYQDLATSAGIGTWSIFVVVLISALVGHWLWAAHPAGGRRLKGAQP